MSYVTATVIMGLVATALISTTFVTANSTEPSIAPKPKSDKGGEPVDSVDASEVGVRALGLRLSALDNNAVPPLPTSEKNKQRIANVEETKPSANVNLDSVTTIEVAKMPSSQKAEMDPSARWRSGWIYVSYSKVYKFRCYIKAAYEFSSSCHSGNIWFSGSKLYVDPYCIGWVKYYLWC